MKQGVGKIVRSFILYATYHTRGHVQKLFDNEQDKKTENVKQEINKFKIN